MSYVLGLSLIYDKYKKDAVIRIYADERLVEELVLSENINYKTIIYQPNDCPFDPKSLYNYDVHGAVDHSSVLIIPEKLFLFQIKEEFLTHSVRVEIDNNDNNYTNGFMTKNSIIKFHDFFLLPTRFLEEKNYLINLKRFDNYEDQKIDHDNYFPFGLTALMAKYPMESKPPDDLLITTIGGSFTIEIPLYKKYKLIK